MATFFVRGQNSDPEPCVKCGDPVRQWKSGQPACSNCFPDRPRSRKNYGLTSESNTIKKQREEHYDDLVQPWDGDRPNQEFVDRYPDLVPEYYNKQELKENEIKVNLETAQKVKAKEEANASQR